MHDNGESYSGIVPARPTNKGSKLPAETVEGRPLTKENVGEPNPDWTLSQENGQSGLDRVREAARRNGKVRFTALLHHVTVDLLRGSYFSLKRKAATHASTGLCGGCRAIGIPTATATGNGGYGQRTPTAPRGLLYSESGL
jgi:hypothetical protein